MNKIVLTSGTPRHSISTSTPSVLYNLQRLSERIGSAPDPIAMLNSLVSPAATPPPMLPAYIKPLPGHFSSDDITYLQNKGVLTIPNTKLRNELIRCYAEFVHPYMPLIDLHEFIGIIDRNEGTSQLSLLLFQSVMFASVATVDMCHLSNAGYATRRDARREFFNKTRLLYDFGLEVDRISVIQSLLLMTYWYETPDDPKDSHHWMSIAVSLSQTIGLHCNPDNFASIEPARQKLWKRIWWSTYMRDRLIALGTRRPTRIKTGDFDVPMLEVEDFEIAVLPEGTSCIPADCTLLRDVEKQRQLAVMCVAKAKLCMCISTVLSVQYSVLHNNHGVSGTEGTTQTTMMLLPKKAPGIDGVQACDQELQEWRDNLPEEAHYVVPMWNDVEAGNGSMALNRSLLHMIYYSTLSALHRPQVLPSSGTPPRDTKAGVVDRSRKAVRLAAGEITTIAKTLYDLDLVRRLPPTGITVLLPAVIIHLLDIKAPDENTRRSSLHGFCQCMQIMARLRDIYAAADYSTAFLEAAIRKAGITLPQKSNEIKDPRNVITSTQGLMKAGRRMKLTNPPPENTDSGHLIPPPDDCTLAYAPQPSPTTSFNQLLTEDDIARRLNPYLAVTSPDIDHHASTASGHRFTGSEHGGDSYNTDPFVAAHMDHMDAAIDVTDFAAHDSKHIFSDGAIVVGSDFEPDFDSMVNLDGAEEMFGGALDGECA